MRRQAFDVLVVGPTERDLLFVAKSDAPVYGRTIDVKEVPVTIAGSGANVAVALARLGLKVSLITAVGRDPRGEEILRELAAEGVDTGLASRTALAQTGLAVTVLRDGGMEPPLVLRSRGSNDLVEVTEDVQKMLHTSRWLFLGELSGSWEQQALLLLDALTKEETHLAWQPGREQIAGNREPVNQLLEQTDLLFVDAENLKALAGSGTAQAADMAAQALLARGVKAVVVFESRDLVRVLTADAHLVGKTAFPPVVDPRGAWDAFCGGFLAGYVHGNGDAAAGITWGFTNCRSVVGTLTTQRGLLNRAVLEDRARKTPVTVERRATTGRQS